MPFRDAVPDYILYGQLVSLHGKTILQNLPAKQGVEIWNRLSCIGIKGKMGSSWRAAMNIPVTQKQCIFQYLCDHSVLKNVSAPGIRCISMEFLFFKLLRAVKFKISSKGNKTVPGKLATTRTEDGQKQNKKTSATNKAKGRRNRGRPRKIWRDQLHLED